MGMTGVSGEKACKPSIAETTVMEGVIMPSATKVLAPMIAAI